MNRIQPVEELKQFSRFLESSLLAILITQILHQLAPNIQTEPSY